MPRGQMGQKPSQIQDADNTAELAYKIYRGMKTDPMDTPHWDELTNEQRGLLEWTARFAALSSPERI